jgi:hypothetical protein
MIDLLASTNEIMGQAILASTNEIEVASAAEIVAAINADATQTEARTNASIAASQALIAATQATAAATEIGKVPRAAVAMNGGDDFALNAVTDTTTKLTVNYTSEA